MVRAHPEVAYLLPAGLESLFEQGLCEPSVVHPVGVDPAPMGGCQALLGFLGLTGFLN